MYRLTPSGSIALGDAHAFSMKRLKSILGGILTRKECANGLIRWLVQELAEQGRFELPRNQESRIICERSVTKPGKYRIILLGERSGALLRQLNSPYTLQQAIEDSRERRRIRRERRKAGLVRCARVRPHRAVPALRQKQHFRRSKLTVMVAIAAISHAARVPECFLKSSMTERLRCRAQAVFTLSDGFLFVLRNRPGGLELHSTDDSRHPAYRRLRSKLRKLLKCERRVRSRRQLAHREECRQRRMLMRFIA